MTQYFILFFAFFTIPLQSQEKFIITGGSEQNDIVELCRLNHIPYIYIASPKQAVEESKRGQGIFFVNDSSTGIHHLEESLFKKASKKKLRIFSEFYTGIPGLNFKEKNLSINKERVVVNGELEGLESMDILSINSKEMLLLENGEVFPNNALLVLSKVAGNNKAEYGLEHTAAYSLLFHNDGFLISTIRLSNMLSGRFGPSESWKSVYSYILSWLTNEDHELNEWPVYVKPSYGPKLSLPKKAIIESVVKGTDWFFNAKLLVHPSWEELYYKNTNKNGKDVVNPPVSDSVPIGSGLNGILEGQASRINPDGSQPYRWWIRADAQAETAYALSSTYLCTETKKYATTAQNLLTYLFDNSNLRSGERDDPNSPSFGLIGWSTTDPDAYYGDDNARALLSVIGASTNLKLNKWDKKIIEGILGNFRTAGKNGFRGPWFRDAAMQKTTWQKLGERNIVNIHPHYESWLWALYIWLYDKTAYEPLLSKAKEAIGITMDAFPDWKWTNGIQQEYARMILPLSWLLRVEDTPKHRQWLDKIISQLLSDIDSTGAIPEKFGKKGLGRYEKISSNEEYGTKEAPLISTEEDKISDLLYTMNFALFSINEAAEASDKPDYREAAKKMAEFMVRIQIESEEQEDLDGAWFRAFDYGKWDYWASNADSDWGPWGTLTGWTQSWIINGLINQKRQQSLWERSKSQYDSAKFKKLANSKIKSMLEIK